jgi:hypothetical protein
MLLEALPTCNSEKSLQTWLESAVAPEFLSSSLQQWEQSITGVLVRQKCKRCFDACEDNITVFDMCCPAD